MTDLTPEQIKKWADDTARKEMWAAIVKHVTEHIDAQLLSPGTILYAHATILQQQAENAEQQATIERLEAGLVEIREIYAGTEGFDAETAPEAYLQRIVGQMYAVAREALQESQE